MNQRNQPRLAALPLAAVTAIISLCAAPSPARAERELHEWAPVVVQGPLSKRLLGYLELQTRVGDEMRHLERAFVRPAIGYRLTRNVSVWQGYAFVPQFKPTEGHEHRLFQQLLVTGKSGKTALINRTRLEERFIHGAGGTSVRARHLVRALHPVSKDRRWLLVGSNETFFNLNSVPVGPKAGFDQNRLYFGIGRQVNKKVLVEAGYLWSHINTPSGPDRNLDVLLTGVTISL